MQARSLGFEKLSNGFVAAQAEALLAVQFGHEVVIVGVEPFGHFQRAQIHAIALHAAGQCEITGDRIPVGQRAIGIGDGVEQEGRVQHMVVQRKIVAGHDVGAGVALQAPMPVTQRAGGVEQRLLIGFALPEGFQRAFEFALRADAREAEIGNGSHWWCVLDS